MVVQKLKLVKKLNQLIIQEQDTGTIEVLRKLFIDW